MNKPDLMRNIAETAYNAGYGAKKHFATYDIAEKIPGVISFASISIGIFALFIDIFSSKFLSASLIVLGVVGVYIASYDDKKQEYATAGENITSNFNRLKTLYFNVKDDPEDTLEQYEKDLKTLQKEYCSACITKQILFSDWYAHYKFFWQQQIDWIDEEKHFRLWRDKIPLSFTLTIISIILCLILTRCYI